MQPIFDIPAFYKNLINCSIRERTSLASEINDHPQHLSSLLENTLSFHETYRSNKIFLFLLQFGSQYIRIPYLLLLHKLLNFEIIKKEFDSMDSEEKFFLKCILENILEIFMDLESNQINSQSAEHFIKLYDNLYDNNFELFLKRKLKNKLAIFQTEFEKIFNKNQLLLKKIAQEMESIEKNQEETLLKSLSSIIINYKFCRNHNETVIFKELESEKVKFANILKKKTMVIPARNINKLPEIKVPDIIFIDKESVFQLFEKALASKQKKKIVKMIILDDSDSNCDENTKKNDKKQIQTASTKLSTDLKDMSLLENYYTFELNSHLPFLEGLEIEFKNYFFPFQFEKNKIIIKNTICSFLNTNGGRIYFGIRDEDQCVVGLRLSNNMILQFNETIQGILESITPVITNDECVINYIPITQLFEIVEDLYVVKVIIKRGKLNDLYFTNDRISFKRRNGNNFFLCPYDLKSEIISRSQLDEIECEKENFEYNKKFYECEKYIKQEKIKEVKNSKKRNYDKAIRNLK